MMTKPAILDPFQGCYLPNATDQHTTVGEVALTAGDEGEMPVGSEIRSVTQICFFLQSFPMNWTAKLPQYHYAYNFGYEMFTVSIVMSCIIMSLLSLNISSSAVNSIVIKCTLPIITPQTYTQKLEKHIFTLIHTHSLALLSERDNISSRLQ